MSTLLVEKPHAFALSVTNAPGGCHSGVNEQAESEHEKATSSINNKRYAEAVGIKAFI